FEEDFRKKVLEQNDDDDDTTGIPKELPYGTGKETRIVAYPFVAANVDQASPAAQRSRTAILHATPTRMTKKAAKRTS
ncbi:hypothetical protein Tco_1469702, partial [Tanacetum coccineum]